MSQQFRQPGPVVGAADPPQVVRAVQSIPVVQPSSGSRDFSGRQQPSGRSGGDSSTSSPAQRPVPPIPINVDHQDHQRQARPIPQMQYKQQPQQHYMPVHSAPEESSSGLAVSTSFLVMACLILFPLVHTIQLLVDESYVYWYGVGTPLWLLLSVCGLLCLWTGSVFFLQDKLFHGEDHGFTLFNLVWVYALLLSVLLIGNSIPLVHEAQEVPMQLLTNCQYGSLKASILERDSAVRARSKNLLSANADTAYLDHMEETLGCNNFCFPWNFTLPTAGSLSAPAVAPLMDVNTPTCAVRIARHLASTVGWVSMIQFWYGLALIVTVLCWSLANLYMAPKRSAAATKFAPGGYPSLRDPRIDPRFQRA